MKSSDANGAPPVTKILSWTELYSDYPELFFKYI